MQKPTSCSLFICITGDYFCGSLCYFFFQYVFVIITKSSFYVSCDKTRSAHCIMYHFVSSTEQHIELLKGDTLFTQQVFEGCFHNFLSIATDYFHRLRTHLVSLLNRLLFPRSASGRIKLLFLKNWLIFLRSTVFKTWIDFSFRQLLNAIFKFFISTNEFTGILGEYKGMLPKI